MSLKPIAITCGDPAGVGPEIIEEWLKQSPNANIAVFGPQVFLDKLSISEDRKIACGPKNFKLSPGEASIEGAKIALEAMDKSAQACIDGQFRAVVTAPVSKAQLKKVGYKHPGQTEFFAEKWGGEPTMAFVGEKLKVILSTWHIPLLSVKEHLTETALTTAIERASFLGKCYGLKIPKIGVCGLNPHAGEEGILGTEERDFIDPLLNKLRQSHPNLSRTEPSDTVFHRALQSEFDVIVALYHDQGLGPLKTLEFDTAVNTTLGLPFIRTSPDHGTAFGIAGKGIASIRSFSNAVTVAERLS